MPGDHGGYGEAPECEDDQEHREVRCVEIFGEAELRQSHPHRRGRGAAVDDQRGHGNDEEEQVQADQHGPRGANQG